MHAPIMVRGFGGRRIAENSEIDADYRYLDTWYNKEETRSPDRSYCRGGRLFFSSFDTSRRIGRLGHSLNRARARGEGGTR